jgi:HEAT repeat protein
MGWTPASGATQLRKEFPQILDVLRKILTGSITSRELARDPTMLPILYGIGGNTALNLLKDPSGTRLAHWPRAWAARTLAIIGDTECSTAFVQAAKDQEWRVRMQAMRAAGLVSDSMTVDRMAGSLASDSHRRVREAVALSLGRKGSELCLDHLRELTQDAEVSVRRAAERAITRLQSRFHD